MSNMRAILFFLVGTLRLGGEVIAEFVQHGLIVPQGAGGSAFEARALQKFRGGGGEVFMQCHGRGFSFHRLSIPIAGDGEWKVKLTGSR